MLKQEKSNLSRLTNYNLFNQENINSFMDNTQIPINQNSLPHIQNLFNQCHNNAQIPISPAPQECGYYLSNENQQINNSGLTRLSINNPSESHINSSNTNERQSDLSSTVFSQQYNTTTSKRIGIKSQPRPLYHPRTEKESGKVAHYIRCEEGDASEYPAIYLFPAWTTDSNKNYIEVALVDIHNELHPYVIENKERNSSDGQPLISRGTDDATNILFFRVINEDFSKGSKIFKIELIKPKQVGTITKDLIRKRTLEKSKLRFTRIFHDKDGNCIRDVATTVYSDVMTENYGNLAVKHMTPQFGPMSGNTLVDIVFKSLTSGDKKKLSFEISEQTIGLTHKITNFDSTGSTIHIIMPAFPTLSMKNFVVNVIAYYEREQIYETCYLYDADLDEKLRYFDINKPTEAEADPTTLYSTDSSTQNLIINSHSLSTVSKTKSQKNSKKRRHED